MAKEKPKLQALGFGDSMVDMTTFAPTLPPRGGNVWSTAPEISPGGTVANVSFDLALLGIKSGFAGGIAADPYGNFIMNAFSKSKVDTEEVVHYDDAATGIVLAVVDETGERTFIACAKGSAYARLEPTGVDTINFARAQVVHSSGVCLVEEPSRSALLHGYETIKQKNIPLYYDPNLRLNGEEFPEPLKKAQIEAIQFADVVLIGEGEIIELFGEGDIFNLASDLLSYGPSLVVIKQGSRGAHAFTSGHDVKVDAFSVDVVDTTGAGDAFNAGFIAGQIRGYGLQQALFYASAVAGINITRPGARSIPNHEKVLDFLIDHSIKL